MPGNTSESCRYGLVPGVRRTTVGIGGHPEVALLRSVPCVHGASALLGFLKGRTAQGDEHDMDGPRIGKLAQLHPKMAELSKNIAE